MNKMTTKSAPEKPAESPIAAPHAESGKLLTPEEQKQRMLELLNQPPQTDPVALAAHRATMARALALHKNSFRTELTLPNGQKIAVLQRTVEEAIKAQIQQANPTLPPEELQKSLRELVTNQPFPKFDWRSLRVTPFVRNQGDCGSCWAFAATEAFESSLMTQRANLLPTFVTDEQRHPVTIKISLSVRSTMDCVEGGLGGCKAGRHERAFNHFFEFGAPLGGLNIFSETDKEDSDFKPKEGHCTKKEKTGIKALAWDYVQPDPKRTFDIPPELDLKIALLEHGPLVVMVTTDELFKQYGKEPEASVQTLAEDDFPLDNAKLFEGKTHSEFPDHYVLLIGWDDAKEAWIVQNSYGTEWGYQCDGPRVMPHAFRSTDRGFMYIKRGTNDIGVFAAWIEAPLLDATQEESIRREAIARTLLR